MRIFIIHKLVLMIKKTPLIDKLALGLTSPGGFKLDLSSLERFYHLSSLGFSSPHLFFVDVQVDTDKSSSEVLTWVFYTSLF